ncbi:MAG: hypothetical protein H6835_15715 [Planctomycetes bacterium]|nr:hypothetical protein [Planctomycetota bacterium]
MLAKLLSLSLLAVASLCAQDAATAPALPAAGSDAARAMVDQAFAKMLAYGRGMFSSTESHDLAFARQAGLPIGGGDTELSGGWHRDLVFGKWAGQTFVRGNGRVASKKGDRWHLASDRLGGGTKLPFTADPLLLFTVLSQLPPAQRKVVHVDGGKLRERDVAILTLQLSGDEANEFDDHGVAPAASGGFGDVVVFGGLAGAPEPPRADLTTYIACFVDAQNGDLLRLAVRTTSSGGMGGFQIAVGGVFGNNNDTDEEGDDADGAEQEKEKEKEQGAGQGAAVGWKAGFPVAKPGQQESVMTFRLDFTKLGLADLPAIDDAVKPLIGAR